MKPEWIGQAVQLQTITHEVRGTYVAWHDGLPPSYELADAVRIEAQDFNGKTEEVLELGTVFVSATHVVYRGLADAVSYPGSRKMGESGGHGRRTKGR